MRKGLISILLAVIMVINLAPLALATGEITSFTYDSLTAELLTNHELTDFVTKDLILPSELSDGAKITWSSNNEGAITKDGKVTRAKKEEAKATLTATIPGYAAKTFTFTVAPQTTNVIYQDNFAYSIPETTQAINVVPGWDKFNSTTSSGHNKVLYDSTDKLYYLWLNNNTVNYTWYKNTTEVTATNFAVMFDFKYDATNATSKIMDIKADFTNSAGVKKSQVSLVRINNGALSYIGAGKSLPASGWARIYLELDTANLCGRLKIGENDTWSAWSNISDLTSDYAYSTVENFYFRPGAGSSPSGELLFDNFLIAEYIDPAVFDSIEYIKGTLNGISASMFTSESTSALTKNLNLNPQALIDLNTANGTTVSFTSSDSNVIEISGTTGIVKRGAGDKTATVTVTVSHNGASQSKTFTYTVLASEDYVAVKDTYDKLDLSYITSQPADKIKDNLDLNSSALVALNSANSTTVSFTSSDSNVIEISGTTGIVKRGEEKKSATVTATISRGNYSLTKEFDLTILPVGDVAEVEEIVNTIDFDLFTTQSKYAVTKNLNLAPSELTALAASYGATVSFKSNNDALKIEGTTGVINRQATEQTVTLTAEVKKGVVTQTKDIAIVVPSQTTYVYDSNGFGYSEYLDMNAGNLPHWTSDTTGAATAWISKIRKAGNSYYMESVREASFGGRSNGTIFDFDSARKTQKLTLEMTLTYNDADAANGIMYDFEFYGNDSEGNLVNTYGKEMAFMRIKKGDTLYFDDRTKSGKSGSVMRPASGGSNRIRFDFDYENDTLNTYVDGNAVATNIPFYGPAGDGTDDYSSLSSLYISAFRTSAGANLQIDDFVVKCENPVYDNSLIEDASPRPLTVTSRLSRVPTFTITSKYNEAYNIEQEVQLNNYGNHLTKNVMFDMTNAYLVGNGKREAMVAIPSSDNVPPFTINGLYIGANHGSQGRKVTASAHGKTSADIGSVWVDEAGKRYDLLRIIDANTLLFLGHSTDPTRYDRFNAAVTGNLSYDSEFEGNCGVNTGTITVSGNAMDQVFPSISNRVHKVYAVRDGVKEEIPDFTSQAHSFSCDSIIFEDTYYIMNPCKIGETLRAQRPEGGYTTNTPDVAIGEAILAYKSSITYEADGTCYQSWDHTILKDLLSISYGGYQYYPRTPVFGGDVFRVVPGTVAFSAPKYGETTKTTFDFSLPYKVTLKGTTTDEKLTYAKTIFPNGYMLGSSGWANPEKAPDRMLEYHSDADGELVSVFATGFFPLYDAAPDVRPDNVKEAVYFYNSAKAYPYAINGASDFAKKDAKIQGVAYRKYYDLTKRDTTCEMYTVNKDQDIYFYIDYFEDGTDTINLADEYIISDIEVVQKSDNIDYTISGNTIKINGKARDYLVLKAKRRGIEIVASVYDDTIRELQVNAHNIDSTTLSGKLVAAGYDKNDKMTFFKSGEDVSIDKDNYKFAKVSDVSLNGAVKVKFFILDGITTLKPIAHTNLLTID